MASQMCEMTLNSNGVQMATKKSPSNGVRPKTLVAFGGWELRPQTPLCKTRTNYSFTFKPIPALPLQQNPGYGPLSVHR